MNHFAAEAGPITLFAAFVAGAAGSAHCLAMCGGISGALGMRAKRNEFGPRKAFVCSMTYQAGRIASYAVQNPAWSDFAFVLNRRGIAFPIQTVGPVEGGASMAAAKSGVMSKKRA